MDSNQLEESKTCRHRGTRRRRGIAGTLATAALVGGTAVGALATGPAVAVSGASRTPSLTLAYSAPVSDQLIPLVAADAGIFKKYGLNVHVIYMPATQINDGLVGGTIQLAVYAAPEPEVLDQSGENIQWIAEWEKHADLYLLGQKGVKNLKGLAGKSVAETAAGTTTSVLTEIALHRAGVLKKAHLQPVGTVGATLTTFASGQVAATIAGPPNQTTMLKRLPGSSILVNYTKAFPWVGAGIAVNGGWAAHHVVETRHAMQALLAGITYFEHHKAQSVKIIQKTTNAKRGTAEKAYAATLGLIKKTGNPVPSAAVEKSMLHNLDAVQPPSKKISARIVYNDKYIVWAERHKK